MEFEVFSMYLVYAVVLAISTLAAFQTQYVSTGKNGVVKTGIRPTWFLVSFLLPWAVVAFTRIGVDYANYERIIGRFEWNNLNDQGDSEFGFNLIAMFFKWILNGNVDGSIFCLKTLTITLIYFSIYKMRDVVNVGYSVFFYLLLLYLPSFYLISQFLAASLVTLVMVLYLKKGKSYVCLGLLLLIGQIHNSVYIFVPFFLMCVYLKTFSIRSGLFFLVFAAAIMFAEDAFRMAQTIEGFHYNDYMNSSKAGSGIMLIVRAALMMWIAYMMYRNDGYIKRKVMIIYFAAAISLFNILGNTFAVITRMEFMFMSFYILLLPSYLNYHRKRIGHDYLFYFTFLFILLNGYRVITERIGNPISMMTYYIPFNPFE